MLTDFKDGVWYVDLALQTSASWMADFQDGVWFAELASLTDPTLRPQSVAGVFRVREQPGYTLFQLLDEYLCLKQLLLLIGKAEHLIEACARLIDPILHNGYRFIRSSRAARRSASQVN